MTEIRHGYTLRDIDRCARIACSADRSMASDITTRFSIAWSAIAEQLCMSAECPDQNKLIRTGWQAIYQEVREMRHTFALVRGDRVQPDAAVQLMPKAVQYWFVPAVDQFDGVTEKVALAQIWATLTPIERQVLTALAVYEDYRRAADALGITYKNLCRRVAIARRAFRALWFAPDPAPMHRLDRRASPRLRMAPESAKHLEVS